VPGRIILDAMEVITMAPAELRCDGCGVEITWTPVLARGRRYCCARCAAGSECQCGYVVENEEEGPAILEP